MSNQDSWKWLERATQIAEFLGKALVPIAVAIIGYLGSRWLVEKKAESDAELAMHKARSDAELAMKSAEAAADDRDVAIMTSFVNLYEKNPKFAVRYANVIRRAALKNAVLRTVIWDVLEKNIANGGEPMWNVEHPSWHLIGDAAHILRDTPPGPNEKPFDLWWECDLREYSVNERWKGYASQLEGMFRWIEKTYELRVLPFGTDRCH